MFENTSKKIKICAYIFFVGSLLNQGTQTFRQWLMLGSPSDLLFPTITQTFSGATLSLVISLIIYGFAKIVEYFEDKKATLEDL